MEARSSSPIADARPAPAAPAVGKHIVDALIEERAQGLMSRPRLWPIVKALAYPALGYRRAVEIADTLAPMSGREAMDWAADFLDLTIDAKGVEHVPACGPTVVVGNHPGGIADGVAAWMALRGRRPDAAFFANRDALRVCPDLEAHIIPVEWRPEERTREKTRETLRLAMQAFKEGRCVVIFPAGRMSVWSWSARALIERPWTATATGLARKYDAPVVPLGVRQRLTLLYYALAQVSEELRNMTLFHELLAKRGARYRLRFGPPQKVGALSSEDTAATEKLRAMAQRLSWGRSWDPSKI